MEVCGLFPEDPFGEGEKGAGFYFDLEVLVLLEGAASERTSMYLKVADVKGLEALPVDSLIRACRPVLVLASADEVKFKAYLDGLVGAIYAEDVHEAVSSLEGYFHYGLDLWGSASNAPFERGRFWVGDARLGDGRTLRGLRATDLFDLDHDVVVHFH